MKTFCVAILVGSAALLQAQGPPAHGMGFGEMRFMGAEGGRPGTVVTGAPFSGKQVTTETQTLANGTHITRTITSQFYRDAQGRTRIERTFTGRGSANTGTPKTSIEIFDPVAGVGYMLDPSTQTGSKMALPTRSGNTNAIAHVHERPADSTEQVAKTDLGTQTMQGLTVTGTQTTRTIPANEIGNDQALTITTERWYSPDLQVTVMSKRSDPRMGDVTFELQGISRTAPDASLFVAPSSYSLSTRTSMHGGHMAPPTAAQ